jgi:hypothetical protein
LGRVPRGELMPMKCNECKGRLSRAHRRTPLQYLISVFGVYPYWCNRCGGSCFRAELKQLVAASILVLMTISGISAGAYYGLRSYNRVATRLVRLSNLQQTASAQGNPATGSALAPEQASTAPFDPSLPAFLKNQDIVELSHAGVTNQSIINLIHKVGHSFEVDPKSLVALKRAGTSEEVILAMVESSLPSHSGDFTSPGRPLQAQR